MKLIKNSFIEFRNNYSQIFGNWNWYEFDFLKLYFEADKMTGGVEVVFMFLGLGFRIRYNYDTSKLDEMINGYDK